MIAVLGPGGVGGFIAGALAQDEENDVVVVAREETVEAIARDGLRISSVKLGEWSARPPAVSSLSGPIDVLVVATKATGLETALQRVADSEPQLVVPLLNGLDHVGVLRARFGGAAAVGSIRIEAHRPVPGVIVHQSPFLVVELADDDPSRRASLERFASALERAGVPALVGSSEAEVLWSKLVRLNAIACTTSAWGAPMGEIRANPESRAALEGCVAEASAVATAEGAPTDPEQVMREINAVHDSLLSSMSRDIAARREPELDAIPGAVLRAGARHGIACPTIAALYERIAQRAGIAAPRLSEQAGTSRLGRCPR